MALMKPRRWLGYTICLNDLLEDAPEILDRFERSDVPLDDTFGSSSDPPTRPRATLLYFGPGVEPPRLVEVLDLLRRLPVHHLQTDSSGHARKTIYVGALNFEALPVAPLTPSLDAQLRRPGLSVDELSAVVKAHSTVHALESKP